MLRRVLPAAVVVAAVAAATVTAYGRSQLDRGQAATPVELAEGRVIFLRLCAPCHGESGDGRGPASPFLWPAPRDFSRGVFKWPSTPEGGGLADALRRTIGRGIEGTSMPGFADVLTPSQIELAAVEVLRLAGDPAWPQPQAAGPPQTGAGGDDPGRGLEVYRRLGCVECHGSSGRGDGPAAAGLRDDEGRSARPYDLVANPPRGGREPAAVYRSLRDGVPGTPMPAHGGAASDADLWALAATVAAWSRDVRVPATRAEPTALDPAAIERWRASGGRNPAPAAVSFPAPAQGPPPPGLAPAVASLAPEQCGRCHAAQLRDWRRSIHALAMGPGMRAQLPELDGAGTRGCLTCHAPLAEQSPSRPGRKGKDEPNPTVDLSLQLTGVSCAGCHVRSHVRHGPPRRMGSGLVASPAYPLRESAAYERSDYCLACHQHTAGDVVLAGKPLLNTYREWLEGPYFRQGIVCQHCHMPDREHTWKGVHDPETVRQGVRVALEHKRKGGALEAIARAVNVGTGHFFPTTPTPAAFLRIWLADRRGRPMEGTRRELRIGRHICHDGKAWHELEDSRIRPGEARALSWSGPVPDGAVTLRAELEIRPDAHYEGFYETKLRDRGVASSEKKLYEAALMRARRNVFVAWSQTVSLE